MAHTYFTGESIHKDPLARAFLNEETLFNQGSDQFIDYELTIRPHRYVAISEQVSPTIAFHVLVLLGYQGEVEKLLNNIAAAAGIEPVRAIAETDSPTVPTTAAPTTVPPTTTTTVPPTTTTTTVPPTTTTTVPPPTTTTVPPTTTTEEPTTTTEEPTTTTEST
jgi:hypothetical protein